MRIKTPSPKKLGYDHPTYRDVVSVKQVRNVHVETGLCVLISEESSVLSQ